VGGDAPSKQFRKVNRESMWTQPGGHGSAHVSCQQTPKRSWHQPRWQTGLCQASRNRGPALVLQSTQRTLLTPPGPPANGMPGLWVQLGSIPSKVSTLSKTALIRSGFLPNEIRPPGPQPADEAPAVRAFRTVGQNHLSFRNAYLSLIYRQHSFVSFHVGLTFSNILLFYNCFNCFKVSIISYPHI